MLRLPIGSNISECSAYACAVCEPCHVLCCAVQMGLVSQECLLFQGTIEDNIRYGTAHATSQQVVEAAKAAYAHEFIMAMPHVSVPCKLEPQGWAHQGYGIIV